MQSDSEWFSIEDRDFYIEVLISISEKHTLEIVYRDPLSIFCSL